MKTKSQLRMFSAAKKSNALEFFFYDIIGADWFGDGITSATVQKEIQSSEKFDSIIVHLNSPGGDSFEGIAIHNILRQQSVPVTVIVEGLAASAAFTIAMAGDVIQVAEASMMMLHNAWTIAIGDGTELRKTADILDKHSGTLRDMYAKRSGMNSEEAQTLMNDETWLTADEAIAFGFATEKLDTTPEAKQKMSALVAQYDLSKFSKVPESLKSAVHVAAKSDPMKCDVCGADATNHRCDGCMPAEDTGEEQASSSAEVAHGIEVQRLMYEFAD